jgi:glutamate racemase
LVKQTDFKPEAVLLACTHYPAAIKQFEKKFLNAQILDPALQVAAQLKPILKTSAKAKSLFLTTGSVKQSIISAELAFQFKKLAFKKVSL